MASRTGSTVVKKLRAIAFDTPFPITSGFHCGVDGAVEVVDGTDATIIIPGCAAGAVYPYQIKQINAAGTAGLATDYLALYQG